MIRITGRSSQFTWHAMVDGMPYEVVHLISVIPESNWARDEWLVYSIKPVGRCRCDPAKKTYKKVLAEVKTQAASEAHI